MKNIFTSSQVRTPGSNTFDLSHEKKMTINAAELIPIYMQEILPGDRIRMNSELMVRLMPLLAPMMHKVDVFTHYFFVPNRIIWDEWEDFITGGPDGTSEPIHPYCLLNEASVAAGHFVEGSVWDYLGIPPVAVAQSGDVECATELNALPGRAYLQIINDYYKDPTFEADVYSDVPKTSGVDTVTLNYLGNFPPVRNWEKDYFTSALPDPQRGPDVLIPMEFSVTEAYRTATGDTNTTVGAVTLDNAGAILNATPVEIGFRGDNGTATITDLRRAEAVQKWLEKASMGGYRYVEQLLVYWGETADDARLQRAEYLGGGKQEVVISEVVSTFQDDTSEPQGNMAGHGISVGQSNGFTKHFKEHGWVFGIMSIMPKPAYQNGINRLWTRTDKFDYYWNDLAHIGEQAIRAQELFHDITAVSSPTDPENDNNLKTWAYIPRYAEYKYQPNTVHGAFRSSLAFWGWQRIFTSLPPLNPDFLNCYPEYTPFAVTDSNEDHFYVQVWNNVKAIRKIGYFDTPSL